MGRSTPPSYRKSHSSPCAARGRWARTAPPPSPSAPSHRPPSLQPSHQHHGPAPSRPVRRRAREARESHAQRATTRAQNAGRNTGGVAPAARRRIRRAQLVPHTGRRLTSHAPGTSSGRQTRRAPSRCRSSHARLPVCAARQPAGQAAPQARAGAHRVVRHGAGAVRRTRPRPAAGNGARGRQNGRAAEQQHRARSAADTLKAGLGRMPASGPSLCAVRAGRGRSKTATRSTPSDLREAAQNVVGSADGA